MDEGEDWGEALGGETVPGTPSHDRRIGQRIKVCALDLWCYTPYYDRYLCDSLRDENLEVGLASASYYRDPGYFKRHGFQNTPGLCDIVARLAIGNQGIRRALMAVESCVNMIALAVGFLVSRPDIIHVQWMPLIKRVPVELWFLRFARYLGIKLIYTVHNVLPQDTGEVFKETFTRVYQRMDALICHNQEAKTKLVNEFGVAAQRIWVIPHGPLFHDAKRPTVQESRAWLGVGEDECVVLCQGVVDSYKGIDFLLDAWSRMEVSRPRARLIIAGTGEQYRLRDVERRVASLGIQRSVRLDLKYIPAEELPAYFQAADIIVFPYKENTTSGALLTALPYGKAIVATRLPVFREVLEGDRSALFVEYGDVEGLAAALGGLVRDPNERERLALGAATAARSQDSWSGIARRTARCYEFVLRTRVGAMEPGREAPSLALKTDSETPSSSV